MQVYTYSEARPNLSGVILPATEKSGWSNFWFLNLLSPGYLFPSLKQIISVSRYFLLNNHKAPYSSLEMGSVVFFRRNRGRS